MILTEWLGSSDKAAAAEYLHEFKEFVKKKKMETKQNTFKATKHFHSNLHSKNEISTSYLIDNLTLPPPTTSTTNQPSFPSKN